VLIAFSPCVCLFAEWFFVVVRSFVWSSGRQRFVLPSRRRPTRQRPQHLGQQLLPHLLARRLVEPVQKPPASRRLAQPLIDLEAHPTKNLPPLAHRLQPVADPAAVAQSTRRFHRPVLHTHQGRRCCRRSLHQPRIVTLQPPRQCRQRSR